MMRRGYKDVDVFFLDDEFVGICCGWDFTAEHEWGIKGIARTLGLQLEGGKPFGVKRRKVKNDVSESQLFIKKDGGITYLIFRDHSWDNKQRIDKTQLRIDNGESFAGAWDDGSFGFATNDADVAIGLKQLEEAIRKKDAVVYFGGSHTGLFSNAGLCICIVSRLPKEILDQMHQVDQDAFELKQAAKATGIEKELKKANCKYYALNPRWVDDGKTEVQFWLNPKEQCKYNSMWCSIDDLKLWIKGKGPIVKEKE